MPVATKAHSTPLLPQARVIGLDVARPSQKSGDVRMVAGHGGLYCSNTGKTKAGM